MSWATGWRMRQLKPRSPWRTPPIQWQVLDGDGAIEPEFGADLGEDLGVAAFLAGEDEGGVAGHELLEGEDEDADEQDGGQDLQQARAEVAAHGLDQRRHVGFHGGARLTPWRRMRPSLMGRKPVTRADMPTRFFCCHR